MGRNNMNHGFIDGMPHSAISPLHWPVVFPNGFNNRDFPIGHAGSYRHGTVRNLGKRVWTEAETHYIEVRYEREINAFGYGFREFQAS